jgi:hypothetical protein
MKTLKQTLGMLNVAYLFIMLAIMFVVGIVAESTKSLFTKVKDHELSKQPFESISRDFTSYSKPALY